MKCPRICQAKAINDCTLVIEFTNHEVKKYDIAHLLEDPMFAPLRQPALQRSHTVEVSPSLISSQKSDRISNFPQSDRAKFLFLGSAKHFTTRDIMSA